MQRTTTKRALTSKRVVAILGKAGIAKIGATQVDLVGPGNPYTREDGTAIVIRNVAMFRSAADAKAASDAWIEGHKLELSGDIEGAQEHFIAALNKLMSFSVLADNAPAFDGIYSATVKVEEVENRAGETVLGINYPRPVAVANTQEALPSSLFTYVEEKAPKTSKAGSKLVK